MSANTSILRNRKFLLLWLGQLLSQMGTRIYSIALAWWILKQNESQAGLKMAVLLVLSSIPGILLAKRVGNSIDRSPHRLKRVLVIADAVALAALLLLGVGVFFSQPGLLLVYGVGLCLAICSAWLEPTLQKSVTQLVSETEVAPAVALLASTTSFASFLGAAAGAVLVETLGLSGCIVVNGLSYLLAFVFTLLIRWPSAVGAAQPAVAAPVAATADGESVLRSFKPLLYSFGLINFFSTPTLLVIPLFVRDRIRGSATDLAITECALWLGFVVGGYLAQRDTRDGENLLLSGSLGLIGLGIGIGLSGFMPNIVGYSFALACAGISLGFGNTKFISHFQKAVPDSVKGRFFAQLSAISSFTFPVSFLFFGALLDHAPIPWICLFQGSGVLLLSAWSFSLSAQTRKQAWT